MVETAPALPDQTLPFKETTIESSQRKLIAIKTLGDGGQAHVYKAHYKGDICENFVHQPYSM